MFDLFLDLAWNVNALAAVLTVVVAAAGGLGLYHKINKTSSTCTPTNGGKSCRDGVKKLRVLQLVGAEKNVFYHNLSAGFARESVAYLKPFPQVSSVMEFVYCVVHPKNDSKTDSNKTKFISFPTSLDESALKNPNLTKYNFSEATKKLAEMKLDCAVTHMFDPAGCTTYRDLLEHTLNISFIGSSSDIMKLTNHKHATKMMLKKHGVSVPAGVLINREDWERVHSSMSRESQLKKLLLGSDLAINRGSNNDKNIIHDSEITFPLIIKACSEDNSIGLGLANDLRELVSCVEKCFRFDNEVVIEEYIPLGREVRMGLVEDKNGKCSIKLPIISYLLDSAGKKVKEQKDKVLLNEKDEFIGFTEPEYKNVVGNEFLTPQEVELVAEACQKAHEVLGCRDFSQFDIRIDPSGKPYILEANLHCSWAPRSVVVTMAAAACEKNEFFKHENLFVYMVKKAAARKGKQKE